METFSRVYFPLLLTVKLVCTEEPNGKPAGWLICIGPSRDPFQNEDCRSTMGVPVSEIRNGS